MKVWMIPTLEQMNKEESGIKRVIEAYHRYAPEFGIEFVEEADGYDLKASHAGTNTENIDVCHSHGLYWSADYSAASWEYKANAQVVAALRQARVITVPSDWVAETIKRDMRRVPIVVPHGIEWHDWQHSIRNGGYVLWSKNRTGDVCDPSVLSDLAATYPEVLFLTTFAPKRTRNNIKAIGVVPHDQMKELVQGAAVYLSTTKETFGIGTLEAMASGVPVLGYAHGGNLALVQHGTNGYLAQPNNIDDLLNGLHYCLKHRDVLGDNGREMAKAWTWEAAMEKLLVAYEKALVVEPATVSVIIPSFNYAKKVGRAIQSAVQQTYSQCKEIVVVDDGSTDDTEQVVGEWTQRDSRVRYLKQENQGVAWARNNGIASVNTKYVCCLDADDALEPEFLDKCVRALERDNSLGIAYTALRYILPDGKTGMSPWPAEWNFDDQLKRRNQVPTCCVYRREMWESLGGYKARYCPGGAGSEDAEFWTRCGAYGWKAQKVTGEPLFIYSWQSGRVSGNKEYSEPDWLVWHPWVTDGQHPIASYATPKRMSHPVRQYDEPLVSVVIPVSAKHQKNVEDALDSLEAQGFRKWEVIIVWDGGEPNKRIQAAYPYATFLWTGPEPMGAGHARNLGAKQARAAFLLFLDADDWLYPEALERMLDEWKQEEAIIYSDYIGKAFIDDLGKLDPKLQQRVIWQMPDGLTAIRYEALDYEPERAQAQPTGDPGRVYTWNLITSLVPKAWHEEVDGFDETLPSWEDVDYWWRLAKRGKCFRRIPEPLVVYHFYTGGRRDEGYSRHQELFQRLRTKHEKLEIVMCKSCGGNKGRTAPGAVKTMGTAAPQLTLNDEDFKLCIYNHPNRGQHTVIGSAVFRNRIEGVNMLNTREGWKMHYGFRGGGDRFLVHVEDIRLAPHLYQKVDVLPSPPRVEAQPIPEPVPIDIGGPDVVIDLMPEEEQGPPAPRRINVAEVLAGATREPMRVELQPPQPVKRGNGFDLQKLPGITNKIADQLKRREITDLEGVLDLGEGGLLELDGVGPQRAKAIYRAAMERAKEMASV